MCDIFDIIKISRVINDSKAPILYIGNELKKNNASNLIWEFAGKNKIPIFTTKNASDIINDNDFLYNGILNNNNTVNKIINKSDIIIFAGLASDTAAEHINKRFQGRKIIHINHNILNSSKIDKENMYLKGNISFILKNLNPLINNNDRKEWLEYTNSIIQKK
jgi:acetolactate synthase I/II/III large subunit